MLSPSVHRRAGEEQMLEISSKTVGILLGALLLAVSWPCASLAQPPLSQSSHNLRLCTLPSVAGLEVLVPSNLDRLHKVNVSLRDFHQVVST